MRLLGHKFVDPTRDTHKRESFFSTIEISLQHIKDEHPQAVQLLSLMSFLNPDAIPECLLTSESSDSLDFDEAADKLLAYSLITVNGGTGSFRMHRLVQGVTQTWLNKKENAATWFSCALKKVSTRFPNSEFENWAICAELLPHADAVLRCECIAAQDQEARASLLLYVSSYHYKLGRFEIKDYGKGVAKLTRTGAREGAS